ncbi:sugar kinase [Pseudarthrobacter oxydans]|uniref:sugar kinase n=1 Tax=Pseudarthrobacter oxydans TaxID=1671 RepID=UPI00344E116D
MTRIAAVGECMVELTHRDTTTLALGFAGDTFNTATYLARLGGDDLQVDYITRVGTDLYSEQMIARMESEGIGTSLIERVDGATPGLYLVRTDAAGERSFTYHRSTSPARDLFGSGQPTELDEALTYYDVLYLSAITLQILSEDARVRLWKVLDALRKRGGRVVFDTNYRAAGWASRAGAAQAIVTALRRTDLAFPTFDDERRLFGDSDPATCARRITTLGVEEVVVKNGADGCFVGMDDCGQTIPAKPVHDVVDTTGAGDAFNAGYLAARLRGQSPVLAAVGGHKLAADVIRRPGAIIPLEGDGSLAGGNASMSR